MSFRVKTAVTVRPLSSGPSTRHRPRRLSHQCRGATSLPSRTTTKSNRRKEDVPGPLAAHRVGEPRTTAADLGSEFPSAAAAAASSPPAARRPGARRRARPRPASPRPPSGRVSLDRAGGSRASCRDRGTPMSWTSIPRTTPFLSITMVARSEMPSGRSTPYRLDTSPCGQVGQHRGSRSRRASRPTPARGEESTEIPSTRVSSPSNVCRSLLYRASAWSIDVKASVVKIRTTFFFPELGERHDSRPDPSVKSGAASPTLRVSVRSNVVSIRSP